MPTASVRDYRHRYSPGGTYTFRVNGENFSPALTTDDILFQMHHPRLEWVVKDILGQPTPSLLFVKAKLQKKSRAEVEPRAPGATDPGRHGISSLTIIVTNPGGPVVVPSTPTLPEPTPDLEIDET